MLESRMIFARLILAVLLAVVVYPAQAEEQPAPATSLSYAGPAVVVPDLPDAPPPRDDLDSYGGWKGLKGQATGFFHVEQLGGRTWFVTPEGNAFFMLHMCWAPKDSLARLKSWGFNASEIDTGMAYTAEMHLFHSRGRQLSLDVRGGYPPWVTFPDVFDPVWEKECKEAAQNALAPHAQDPFMIGYYLDNERGLDGWYEAATRSPKDAPCRAAFVEVARAYYAGKDDALAKDWKTYGVAKVDDIMNVEGTPPDVPGLAAAWETAVAEKALGTASMAAKAAAPNHLNLGMRFVNGPMPSPAILAVIGKYCDVISLNLYNMLPDRLLTQIFTLVPAISQLTGRPTLSSEFSFRGGDTGLPNTVGAWPTVKTQAERAIGYLSYVSALASLPTHIGVSWYKYPDDTAQNEWKTYGEDCNFGVIDSANRPYAILTEGMKAANTVIYEMASDPVRSKTCPLFYRTELARWDRAEDGAIFQRLMRSNTPFVDPLTEALPEPRRYDAKYWVRHRGPSLTINDDRFDGWCQANMIHQMADATTLSLFNIQIMTTFPRELWLGAQCERPDAAIMLESNAQFLSRTVAHNGQLRHLIMADGSFLRLDYARYELRCDVKAPYVELNLNHDTRELTITTRGPAKRLDLAGVKDWRIAWNDLPSDRIQIADTGDMTSVTR